MSRFEKASSPFPPASPPSSGDSRESHISSFLSRLQVLPEAPNLFWKLLSHNILFLGFPTNEKKKNPTGVPLLGRRNVVIFDKGEFPGGKGTQDNSTYEQRK